MADPDIKNNVILERCIHKLETMKFGTKDERPKRVEKLKNALRNETQVLYATSTLKLLMTMDNAITISKLEYVEKSEKDLNEEIAGYACRKALAQGRRVQVLPCDSNLHVEIEAQIEKWYSEKDRLANTGVHNAEEPVAPLAEACSIDQDPLPEQALRELETLGFIRTDGGMVTYNLPDHATIIELTRVLEKWNELISCNLGMASLKGYHLFADLIMKANQALQNSIVEKFRVYCDDQCADKYPMFQREYKKPEQSIEMKDEVNGKNTQDQEMRDAEDEMESMQISCEFPSTTTTLLPITLQPEISAFVIELAKAGQKPSSYSALLEFLKPLCRTTYITSPKYILTQFFQKKSNQPAHKNAPQDFLINLHLGSGVTKTHLRFRDPVSLATILSECPGNNTKPRNAFSGRHYLYQRTKSSTFDQCREIFRNFIKQIRIASEQRAQRARYLVVLYDEEAEKRCQQRLLQWTQEMNSNENAVVNSKTFSDKLVELSQEKVSLPVEELIGLLQTCGYLDIQGDSIVYKLSYTRPAVNKDLYWVKFFDSWEPLFKKCQEDLGNSDSETSGSSGTKSTNSFSRNARSCASIISNACRKRPIESYQIVDMKKRKVIEIK